MDYVSFDYCKKNEVYLQIKAEPHVYYELADQFTFDVPGAKDMLSIVTNTGMEKYIYLIPKW